MPTWLGIDIRRKTVKVAVVRSTYGKVALTRVASVEVAPAARGTIALAIRGAAAAALQLQEQAQGLDAIAVAVDGSRAAIHRLLVPATAEKQLVDVLAYELEAQVPFDLAGAVFDWKLLENRPSEGQLAIVAAVVRIEDVRERIDVVREALSQEPERVGVGAFVLGALVPYVAALAELESVAVVDLGEESSEVLVLEQGEPVFARTTSTGTSGLPDTAERLARDLRVSFAAHQANGGKAPSGVYLCGDGAFVSGAEGFLSGSLGVPVQLLPEPTLDLTTLAPEALLDLPRYGKAVALALSLAGRGAGMNLRRGSLAFERGFAWVRERVPVLAGLAWLLVWQILVRRLLFLIGRMDSTSSRCRPQPYRFLRPRP